MNKIINKIIEWVIRILDPIGWDYDKERKKIYLIVFIVFSVVLFLTFLSASPSLIDDVVAYWKLDEISGTNAEDSHASYDGTATNTRVFTSEVTGIINTGADFSQGDDAIDIHDTDFQITPISVSLWAYPTENAGGGIFSLDRYRFRIHQPGDNTIQFIIWDGGAYEIITSSGGQFGKWIHLVITMDASNEMDFYIDGSSIGTEATSGVAWGNFPASIGATGDVLWWTGDTVDEVVIFNIDIGDAGVTELYGDGTPPPYPFVGDAYTSFYEDWEDQNFINWSNFEWVIASDQKIGDYSVKCPAGDDCDMNTTVNLNTTSKNVNVSFSYFDDDCDAGDVIWYWKNSTEDWVSQGNIDGGTLSGDDAWYFHTLSSSDSQYQFEGFSIRFFAGPGGGENYWLDNINISTTTTTPPEDTCTYSSGNWNVECSDHCNITDVTSLPSNNLTLNGTGTLTILANITADMVIMDTNCQVVNLAGDNKNLMVI